jgi:hypothetical protein
MPSPNSVILAEEFRCFFQHSIRDFVGSNGLVRLRRHLVTVEKSQYNVGLNGS